MLRFLWRFVAFLAEMNGYTPFFQALFKAYLAIIVGGLSVLSGWVCSVFGSRNQLLSAGIRNTDDSKNSQCNIPLDGRKELQRKNISESPDAAKSIYKCPSCQKNGVYAPTEKVIRRVHTKTVYDWSRGKTERGIRIPEKICTLDVTYIMEGRCNECGYVDTNTYKREETVTGTTECPLCHTTLKITEEDGVHFEKCPKCDFTAVIVKTRPASAPTENPFAPIEDEPKSCNEESEHEQKERERREEEDRNFLNHQLQENKRKAQEEHDKHLEEAEKAKFYKGKAEDADDPDEASEAAER